MDPEKPSETDRSESSDSVTTEAGVNAGETQAAHPLPASEFAEAIRLIQAIGNGRDPFTQDSISQHLPEHHPRTVKALCVAVTYLAEQIGITRQSAIAPVLSDDRGAMPLEDYLREIEKREILMAIDRAKNNKTEAARRLGITFRALRYKLEQMGIDSE
jgi:DNA-binding NtrC family response regulator